MKLQCILTFLVILSSTIWAEAPLLSVAPAKVAPTVDGVIHEEEWCDAVAMTGLADETREAHAWIAIDQTSLYIAMRSELPPDGKLTANVKQGGSPRVVYDDAVEVWIAPPDEGRPEGPLGKGHFQLLVNSIGSVYASHKERGYGLADTAWKADAAIVSTLHDGVWDAELSIPLKSMGVTKLVAPATWRLHLIRNFKDPWKQRNFAPEFASFANLASSFRLQVDPRAPTIQVRSVAGLSRGVPTLSVHTDQGQRPLKLNIRIEPEGMPAIEEERLLESSGAITLNPTFTVAEKNTFFISVAAADGKEWYRRSFTFGPEPTHKWTMLSAYRTFSLNFDDESLTATTDGGKGQPLKVVGAPSYTQGIRGKALSLPPKTQIDYESVHNLPIPCGVSFWVRLDRDAVRDEAGALKRMPFFFTHYNPKGYLGLQVGPNGLLNLWLTGFAGLAQERQVNTPFRWERDRWRHLGFNISDQKAELFVDGTSVGSAEFASPLTADDLRPMALGAASHLNGFAIDEVEIFSRPFTADEAARLAHGGATAIDGQIAFFPSLPALVLDAVADPAAMADSPVRLIMTDAAEDKHWLEVDIDRKFWHRTQAGLLRISQAFDLPTLPDGTYKAWLEYRDAERGTPVRALQRGIPVEHYPWEGNQLGLSEIIIPPFTPIEVNDQTVNVILRSHQLGPLGLWQQVDSLDKPLLQAPMAMHATAAGKELPWKHEQPHFTSTSGYRTTLEATSSNAAFTAKTRCVFDYDGLMTVTLQLEPGTQATALDRLYLDIPLRREIATLFHAGGEGIRSNPAGELPAGDGVIWHSRQLAQPVLDNFIGYIWVGGPQRGICWVADRDKDWVHSEARDAVELVRTDKAVIIRVNLLNGPITLDRPREITFALQASPVKPMPPQWRAWALQGPGPGTGQFTILWPPSWGANDGWASCYPQDKDYSLVDKLMQVRKDGGADADFVAAWAAKVQQRVDNGQSSWVTPDSARRHALVSLTVADRMHTFAQEGRENRLVYYTNANTNIRTPPLPETPVYGDEWAFLKDRHNCTASFRDYSTYWCNEMLERGMDGIYIDNTFGELLYSWPVGDAWRDEQGVIHPSLGILSRVRPFLRRLATLMVERGQQPFLYVHMTNGGYLPELAFAQAQLGWEYKYNDQDYQDKFTPGYMRTLNTGLQAGAIPTLLGGTIGLEKDPAEYVRVTRTGLAMALPHETFFYARLDTKTCITARNILETWRTGDYQAFPYWDAGSPVIAPASLLVTTYSKPNRLLLVVGNMGDAGVFPITLKPGTMPSSTFTAVNRESGASIPVDAAGTVQLSLARHDYALLELATEPTAGEDAP